jgi:MarR family transcriptional regulator, lower aerobic nicotinate degradation pathway regulator
MRTMHFVPFAFKRAHRSSLALVRPWLKGTDITPARYDILYAIHASVLGARHQADLCRVLGLSGATISRAVARLEELGLVARSSFRDDRRLKMVELTKLGLAAFRRVFAEIIKPAALRLAYERAIGGATHEARRALSVLGTALRGMATSFGDISRLHYPADYPPDPIRR